MQLHCGSPDAPEAARLAHLGALHRAADVGDALQIRLSELRIVVGQERRSRKVRKAGVDQVVCSAQVYQQLTAV